MFIVKNAVATKIQLSGTKTEGVEYEVTVKNKVKKLSVKAKKDVIISAGAVNSAKLLMLSGLGPKEHLQELDIPVVVDSPVGQNLLDHVWVPLFFTFHKGAAPTFDPSDFADYYYQYLRGQVGILSTMGVTDAMGFVNTENKTALYPNIQYIFLKLDRGTPVLRDVATNFGFPPDMQEELIEANKEANLLLVCVTLLKPASKGEIKLKSADPKDPPQIITNYLKEASDIPPLVKGIRIFREFLDTQLFKYHDAEELRVSVDECDNLKFDSDEYWTCYSRQLSTTLYHPTGTTRFGPDTDKSAVQDPRLRFRGVKGLRVIDAGALPTIPAGNTMAPTIMVAERAADFIKEDWQAKAKDEL